MQNKLSVCILALNEEKNIKACLQSIQNIADEIVVVIDDKTTDRTADIAKNYTKNVIIKNHEDNFHKNKQYTLERAQNNWILWMDADEAIEPELADEFKKVLENPTYAAYKIPRKNMMFGKWIEHTGWYPDYQIRLFQKSNTHFPCQRIHEDPKVDGELGTLENHIIHHNYQSITHFIDKLNKYTSNDANYQANMQKYHDKDLLIKPTEEFCKRFMMWKGYRDGSYGLILSQLQAMYALVTAVKVMELDHFNSVKSEIPPDKVDSWLRQVNKIWRWWYWEDKIRNNHSYFLKLYYKILRKIGY